jgi:hypothetical protein
MQTTCLSKFLLSFLAAVLGVAVPVCCLTNMMGLSDRHACMQSPCLCAVWPQCLYSVRPLGWDGAMPDWQWLIRVLDVMPSHDLNIYQFRNLKFAFGDTWWTVKLNIWKQDLSLMHLKRLCANSSVNLMWN